MIIIGKTLSARFLIFLLMFATLPLVKANHISGSEITYYCTGVPGIYDVYLKVYRDCQGVQLCANCPSGLSPSCQLPLSIKGASGSCLGSSFGTQNVTVVTGISGFDVVQLCASSTTICNNCGTRTAGSYAPGIEVYTFQGQVNLTALPPSCCMVSIGWGDCCRSGNISTLASPGSLSFFSEAVINRCVTPCNSSPIFTNEPILAVCAGQDFSYNVGAIDPDGDSLSYAFGQSLTAFGTAAPYISPYSQTVPFPYLGAPIQSPPAIPPIGIYIDPVTGDIRFRPVGGFGSNLVIEVKQWKYVAGIATLVGITRRDLQFFSQTCANNPPPV